MTLILIFLFAVIAGLAAALAADLLYGEDDDEEDE